MRCHWLLLLTLIQSLPAAGNWLEFRGPNGQGISEAKDLPLTWSEGQNIQWKTALPGRGASSPIVLSNQIWLTTATDNERSLRALLERSLDPNIAPARKAEVCCNGNDDRGR